MGKDQSGCEIYIDLEKENIHFILLTGTTGSGKSIFHNNLYYQLVKQNTPEEVGFVFLDMTRVDFTGWQSPYMLFPTLVQIEEALSTLEKLGEESERRVKGHSETKRAILIHIEECDMVAKSPGRFEKAILNILKYKDKNNMFLIFSTSRPSEDVVTQLLLQFCDLKVVFQVANTQDSQYLLGNESAAKLTLPGEKILAFYNKQIKSLPFTDSEAEKLKDLELRNSSSF